MDFISLNESETVKLAEDLAQILGAEAKTAPVVILISGNLGMGKSVFARAFIRTLCRDKSMDVPSPTFTLLQQYDAGDFPVHHFDLYRLKDPEEIYEIGWEDAIIEGISLVEWPERLDYITVDGAIKIHIAAPSENERCITLTTDADEYLEDLKT